MPQKKLCVNYSEGSLRNSNHLLKKVKRESIESFPNFYTTKIDICFLLPSASLCCLKSYVMMFQGDSPLIHKVYYQQMNLVKEFYSYFVKPSVVAKCKKRKHLLKLGLSEKKSFTKEAPVYWFESQKTSR